MRRSTHRRFWQIANFIATAAVIGIASVGKPQDIETPTATDSLGDPLPPHALLRLGTQRYRHPGDVCQLALSTDEQTVVTIGDELIAWDTATGKERWRKPLDLRLPAASYGLRPLALAGDSLRFYTPENENSIAVWDLLDGDCERIVLKSGKLNLQFRAEGQARSIDVHPGDEKLAVGAASGLVVYDRNGEQLYEIANNPAERILGDPNNDRLKFGGHYSYGRFSPDGNRLAVITSERSTELQLVDSGTGKPIRSIPLTAAAVRFCFTPDSQRIVVTERDAAVRMYDVEAASPLWSYVVPLNNPFENYTSDVAISPNGQVVAVGATDNQIYLLNPKNGERIGVLSAHAWYPWALAFTKDSRTLYSSGWDGSIRRWDVEKREQLGLPAGVHASGVVAASPTEPLIAYGDDRENVRLFNTQDGTEKHVFNIPGILYSQLCFSPDGSRLAAGGSSADQVHVVVWNIADHELLHRWDWPKGRDPHSSVEALSFDKQANYLAAAVFRQGSAYVWDLNTNQQTAQLKHAEVYGLSCSPDGQTVATAGWDEMIRFWKPATGELLKEFKIPESTDPFGALDSRMYAVCYAPEGGILATAHLDGTVRVWQASDMSLRSQFQVRGRFVYGTINFSADGLWLATGSMDGSIDLFEALSGQKVFDVGQHDNYAYNVCFGRDGKTLVSGGEDGVCYVWSLLPPEGWPSTNPEELWLALSNDASEVAYAARWQLIETPAAAIDLVRTKLERIKIVIDMQSALRDVAEDDQQRRKQLIQQLVKKEEQTEEITTVRRAISLLVELRTPAAIELLEELSHHPQRDIRSLALAGLERTKATTE